MDDDQEQGRHHANFKLSAAEELMLYRVEEGKPRIVDRASGFSPVANQTWALLPDGGSESGFTSGTPGMSNMMVHIAALNESETFLYPNPANTVFFWPEQTSASIFDMNGNLIASDIHYGENNCDYLSNGIYAIIARTVVYRLSIVR